MVLPWISDRKSPAFRSGLLGCPYFNTDSNEILFSCDNSRSSNLKQSAFFNLKSPIPENNYVYNSDHEKEKKLTQFRSTAPKYYFPSSSIEACMNESENIFNRKFNKLNLRKISDTQGYYFAIYPEISKNSIVIDFINEIELSLGQSALNIIDRQEVSFPFIVNNIKSYNDRSFSVLSSQTIKLFHRNGDIFCEAFDCIAPDDDYFVGMDIGRYDLETSSILKNAKKLIIKDLYYSHDYELSNDFDNCTYSSHPSLLILSGNSDKIELKDRRSAFPGLFISDHNLPFRRITALITHDSDENLIALSCKTDNMTNIEILSSELRVYDIRYPKESIMRIAEQTPVSEFVHFDSFFEEKLDNLIGLNSSSELLRWEFLHSKSNRQHMDGILSLTDFSKLSQTKSQPSTQIPEYVGHSVTRSSINENKLFLSRLTSDGEVDYCILSNSEKDFPHSDPNEIFQNNGEIINFCNISDDYVDRADTERCYPVELGESFAHASQSTFHLDFYWDEIKSKICKK